MQAYDAKTGKQVWKFYNTAGPEPGEWRHVGRRFLRRPVAPATGTHRPSTRATNTIFYSVSNASPDFDGRLRAGKNLYAASIIALNATHGQAQVVLPGGSPRPLGLRRHERDGVVQPDDQRPRPSPRRSAEPSKDGMLYVPQPEHRQAPLSDALRPRSCRTRLMKTWPTQPKSPLVFSPQTATPTHGHRARGRRQGVQARPLRRWTSPRAPTSTATRSPSVGTSVDGQPERCGWRGQLGARAATTRRTTTTTCALSRAFGGVHRSS